MARLILLFIVTFSVLPVTAAAENEAPRAMIGITGGVSTITGGSYFYFANQIKTFAPGVEVMVFHPSWFTVIGDFSAALESKQEMKTPGGSGFAVEGSAWYVDVLAGARHTTGSGAFVYLAAGLALSGGEGKTTFTGSDGTSDPINSDVGTTVGFSLGAGGAVPVSGRLCVFLKFRHRMVVGEADVTEPGSAADTATLDFDLGGLETAAGLGITL